MAPPLSAEHLDAFVTFAEHLNFTRAARARRMSQPALHTQVKKLADALGVTLYTKRGARLVLTPDGQRVLGFGRDARERTRAFVAELSHREVQGPIVLCAGEGAYLYLLGEGVRRFAEGGASDLRLLVRDQEGTIEAVRTGEAHLGVASPDALPDGLRAHALTEVGQMAVVPKTHALAAKKAARLRDLRDERLVVPPPGRPHRTMITQAFRAAGVSWRPSVEASGWELLVRFAQAGLGVAIVNAFCRVPEGMVGVPLPELPSRTYSLFQRADSAREGAVSALAKALRETANRWRRDTAARSL